MSAEKWAIVRIAGYWRLLHNGALVETFARRKEAHAALRKVRPL